jgi:hypothetical protein
LIANLLTSVRDLGIIQGQCNNSYTICEHLVKACGFFNLSGADICILRVGYCYVHAVLLIDGWLVDVAHAAWAYNLDSGQVVCTIGSLSVRVLDQYPSCPIVLSWSILPHDFIFDNLSCSQELIKASRHKQCSFIKPFYSRFYEGSYHILHGDEYTVTDGVYTEHRQLDESKIQYVLDNYFTDRINNG